LQSQVAGPDSYGFKSLLATPSCLATFGLVGRVKVTQIYFKVKMRKKMNQGLLRGPRPASEGMIMAATLRFLRLKKLHALMKVEVTMVSLILRLWGMMWA